MYKTWLAVVLISCLASCSSSRKTPALPAASTLVVDGKIWSSLFQQRAAEYKALCWQAFNIAHKRVDEVTATPAARPRAIITDIDETFLDNSPYAVHRALKGLDYDPASWNEWTGKGSADTLPGALGFFKYAASKHIEIFYITNRYEKERAGTLANLQRFGFPFADNQHLILRQDASSKETRRQMVASTHDIIMLLGDNLADFSAVFDKRTEQEREQQVQSLAAEFGKRFIVLPNANYGGWEDAIYQNTHNWTPAQKDSLIKAVLKGY